jgi:ABC-type sulfate/molybdate transport systems ATPase subunit
MVEIELRNITNYALNDVNAKFPSGKLSVIIGPNGAGKTTLLRVVAGLVRYSGNVFFNGKSVDDVPPHERGISYVPQNNALFTHMTVLDNIIFGLRVRGYGREDAVGKVKDLIRMFHLEGLINEYPARLSGGEARKVALARALAIDPKVLLLDEPFTNLDTETEFTVEQEIMMAVKSFRRTVLMVTHSIEKGLPNADNVVILWNGSKVFEGHPNNLEVHTVPEEVRWWFGTVISVDNYVSDNGLCYAEVSGMRLNTVCAQSPSIRKVYIPSNAVRVCRRGSIKGCVRHAFTSNGRTRVVIDVGGVELYTTTPIQLKPGDSVGVRVLRAIPIS